VVSLATRNDVSKRSSQYFISRSGDCLARLVGQRERKIDLLTDQWFVYGFCGLCVHAQINGCTGCINGPKYPACGVALTLLSASKMMEEYMSRRVEEWRLMVWPRFYPRNIFNSLFGFRLVRERSICALVAVKVASTSIAGRRSDRGSVVPKANVISHQFCNMLAGKKKKYRAAGVTI